ncbi:MAG: glycosyltransferase family 4 protein [Akkermansiaceae bacterium]|nr:glycosyltransferase family 4 protein [Akkermansiaceae bacterium]
MTQARATNLLIYCPSSFGGIPDYAHHQAEALGRSGIFVRMLCPPDYPHKAIAYEQERCLPGGGERARSKVRRVVSLVREMLRGYSILAKRIKELGCRRVLLASYGEYLAPLWAWRLRKLKRKGVFFGAVVHDPVRDFVLGPKWWHRWSISEGYSFLADAFVHEAITLDTGTRKYPIRQTVIPHGPFPFPSAIRTKAEVRAELGIPMDASLFLCFGHLRNGKNLNLILEAMSEVAEAWVLVAGTEAGTGHINSAKYQKLAEQLGVDSRCRWVIGFASPELVADFFEATDFALLTYEARFRSASGVLNVAARYRCPVVASCGESNLATTVQTYELGPWVEPDRADEIARGMQELLNQGATPQWDRYLAENSWERNAELVIDAMKIEN